MNRYVTVFALCAVLLCSCGSQSSDSSVESSESAADSSAAAAADSEQGDLSLPESAADLSSAAESLLKGDSDLTQSVHLHDKLFEQNCEKLYGFGSDVLADALILYNAGGGKANEVSVLRRKDGSAETALSALKTRSEQRYRDFDGYAPEELPKIEAARLFTVGSYAVLIISEEADTLEAAVRELLEKLMENF